jgi:prepilin-type N-terminal cleavage/methylation domain-containing protein
MKRAFTLVELLVVMVILGSYWPVCAGPGRAKRKALEMCINNLRQPGVAVAIYADEHGGRLPTAESPRAIRFRSTRGCPHRQVLSNEVAGSAAVFRCPEDAWAIRTRGVELRVERADEWKIIHSPRPKE